MLFGLICGLTNIIPYVGPWIGGGIAAIVGFTVSPLTGILTIAVAFAAQQIDGIVLQPLIMGKTMKLHPVTIMIGLLIFGYFFGIWGMILATPVIACCKVIILYLNDILYDMELNYVVDSVIFTSHPDVVKLEGDIYTSYVFNKAGIVINNNIINN